MLTLKNGKQLHQLVEWYFYKNHIIGKKKKSAESSSSIEYFIVNERRNSILIFESKDRWDEDLKENNLKPFLWTRWFDDNWDHIETLKLYAFLWFPFTIILIIFNLSIWWKITRFEDGWTYGFYKASITPLVIFIIFLLGKFPQSF